MILRPDRTRAPVDEVERSHVEDAVSYAGRCREHIELGRAAVVEEEALGNEVRTDPKAPIAHLGQSDVVLDVLQQGNRRAVRFPDIFE
jgi:hypothetical protein